MFSTKPNKVGPPLEARDHTELDQSDVWNGEEIKQYQTLIGQLQWLISHGRFDIAVHTMHSPGTEANHERDILTESK